MARERRILTESQLAALEKAKADKEAHGVFESECTGYRGVQDTYGACPPAGEPDRWDEKTALTAADLLNDRVIPLFVERGAGPATYPHRSRHDLLQPAQSSRARAPFRDREHRQHPDQCQAPADTLRLR